MDRLQMLFPRIQKVSRKLSSRDRNNEIAEVIQAHLLRNEVAYFMRISPYRELI
jgi:hypothetical protein